MKRYVNEMEKDFVNKIKEMDVNGSYIENIKLAMKNYKRGIVPEYEIIRVIMMNYEGAREEYFDK